MARTKLGIYDAEAKYASKLGAYLMLNEKECIETHIFSDEGRLKTCWEDLDVILVPEYFEECEDPKVIRLVEIKDYLPGRQIRKYQKTRNLVNEVKNAFSISNNEANKECGNIICVVSPSKHELQMLYSMCICKQLSINSKCLYINFSEFSGFISLFCDEESANLEDLMSEIDMGRTIDKYVQINQGVSFIPPTRKPELLYEIDEAIMMDFIRLLKESDYENIVIDVGSFFPQLYTLLNESQKIIALGREGFLNDGSVEEFENNMVLHLGEESKRKVKKVTLPLNSAGLWRSDFILDELFRGNLGDCVREMLKENECENLLNM